MAKRRGATDDVMELGGILADFAADMFKGLIRWTFGLKSPEKEVPKEKPPLLSRDAYLREHRDEIDELAGKELKRIVARRRAERMATVKSVKVPHSISVPHEKVSVPHPDRVRVPFSDDERERERTSW